MYNLLDVWSFFLQMPQMGQMPQMAQMTTGGQQRQNPLEQLKRKVYIVNVSKSDQFNIYNIILLFQVMYVSII
jgi:hypothetical protein